MNTKEAKAKLLEVLTKMTGSEYSSKQYKALISKMSDKEFKEWLIRLDEGKERLCVIVPNGGPGSITGQRNQTIAKSIDLDFFEEIEYLEADGSGVRNAMKSMILDLPGRRLSQSRDTKASVAKDDTHVDFSSGQPTAESSGSRISAPEGKILSFLGLDQSVRELTNARGGDQGQRMAIKSQLLETGTSSLDEVRRHSTGVQSVSVMRLFLLGIHVGIMRDYGIEKYAN